MKRKIGITFLVALFLVTNAVSIFANEELLLTYDQEITNEKVNEKDTQAEEKFLETKELVETAIPSVNEKPNTNEKTSRASRAIVQNGTIGTVDWTLDDAGTLIFSGGNFPSNYAWTALGNLVKADTVTVTFTAPVTAGNTLQQMFAGYTNLTAINGIEKLDTSNVTNMANMFATCPALKNLDLSSFNTSNVANMSSMFNGCTSLESLDVSNFSTNNVTNMSYMFYNSRKLMELNLSSFDTTNVTNMQDMFYNCSSLWKLDISGFNTNNLSTMNGMFFLAPIKELDLGTDFRFKFTNHSLGGPTSDAQYTGQWELVGGGDLFTHTQFLTYDGTKPGKYVWQRVSYNVTYESNGGSAVAGAAVENNAKVTEPTTPTKEGYTFDGWYKEAGLTNKWDFATDLMPTNNITLYAKWNMNLIVLNNAPKINATDKTLVIGTLFNPLEGVTASDDEDGDIVLTPANIVFSDVDINKVGTYKVTYKVADSKGATTMKTIAVSIVKKETIKPTAAGSVSPSLTTGDKSNVWLWLIICIGAIGVLTFILVKKSNKKDKNN